MKKIFLFGLSVLFLSSFSFHPEGLADDILTYTNQFRKSKGRAELIMRDDLNKIAQKHSEDMARGRMKFGHDGIRDREAQASKLITTLSAFAENVAYGSTTGQEVVAMWKNSAGHRSNMLGKFKYIGIGTATDAAGRIYYTQVFVN